MVMDLDARLSWSYVMNKLRFEAVGAYGDPRAAAVSKALYAAL